MATWWKDMRASLPRCVHGPSVRSTPRSSIRTRSCSSAAGTTRRVAAGVRQPDAMTLATVAADGAARRPHGAAARSRRARLRLLHEPRERQGATSCAAHAAAALVFHWRELERQVRVRGPVHRLSTRRSDAVLGAAGRAGHRIERVGVAAERGRRRRRRSRRGSPRSRRGSPTTTRRCPPFWGGYVVGVDELELLAGTARSAARSCALPPRRRRGGDPRAARAVNAAAGVALDRARACSRSATGASRCARRQAARVRLQAGDDGRAHRRRASRSIPRPARATGARGSSPRSCSRSPATCS